MSSQRRIEVRERAIRAWLGEHGITELLTELEPLDVERAR